MRSLEQEIKKEDKKIKIQKTILGIILAAGAISVGLIAPNVISAIHSLYGQRKKKISKYSINRSFSRLEEIGLIEIVDFNGKKVARITSKGKEKLGFLERCNFKLQIPKKWDGRWRLVIFDIKEYKKITRNNLRITLKHIGFVRLQNSVWVYPYDCEDLISLLKADFQIGKDVLYLIVEKLENDWHLLKYFGLIKTTPKKKLF